MAFPDLPDGILAKIIKKAGEGDHWRLGPFIRAAKYTNKIVFADDVLKSADLGGMCQDPREFSIGCSLWEEGRSRNFFRKCLAAGNTEACYNEGIRMAVSGHPLEEVIKLIEGKVAECKYARMTCAMFQICIGDVEMAAENLKYIFDHHAAEGTEDLAKIGDNVKRVIDLHRPSFMGRYWDTFRYPECDVVRTPDCIIDDDPHFDSFCGECYLYWCARAVCTML